MKIVETTNSDTRYFNAPPARLQVVKRNSFATAASVDPHPERTAKVRQALEAAKAKPGTWQSTFCLAHGDEHPSCSVIIDNKGRLGAKCHSQGCSFKEIESALRERGL